MNPASIATGLVLGMACTGFGMLLGLHLGKNSPEVDIVRKENAAVWAAVEAMKELIRKHPYLSRKDLAEHGYGAAVDELDRLYKRPKREDFR